MLTLRHPDFANSYRDNAEGFVRYQKGLGNDVRWEGWDIVFFREDYRGATSEDGAFRNGVWGFDNRFAVDSNGEWQIDYRNVKRKPRD